MTNFAKLTQIHDHDHILGEEDDAHARAHAADIRKRFAGRNATMPQIILFGLTGGLIPCPAAITVLLLCIQLKQFSLGFLLVLCFGIGLAITMVSAGVAAALSLRHVERHWSGFSRFAHRALRLRRPDRARRPLHGLVRVARTDDLIGPASIRRHVGGCWNRSPDISPPWG